MATVVGNLKNTVNWLQHLVPIMVEGTDDKQEYLVRVNLYSSLVSSLETYLAVLRVEMVNRHYPIEDINHFVYIFALAHAEFTSLKATVEGNGRKHLSNADREKMDTIERQLNA